MEFLVGIDCLNATAPLEGDDGTAGMQDLSLNTAFYAIDSTPTFVLLRNVIIMEDLWSRKNEIGFFGNYYESYKFEILMKEMDRVIQSRFPLIYCPEEFVGRLMTKENELHCRISTLARGFIFKVNREKEFGNIKKLIKTKRNICILD